MKINPKYFQYLAGSVLVVMVVQYALLTGIWSPIHIVFMLLQVFCYCLLAVAIFRGLIQRSRLAWLVVQIMLTALFAFSLLCSTLGAVVALKTQGVGIMLGSALAVSVLDGLLLGFLFSLPVCDYFKPIDEDQ